MDYELTVNQKTGEVRQAGADRSGPFVVAFRAACEKSLFAFSRGVLGLTRLNNTLHKPTCAWLQQCPPSRKLLLLPRDHLKTSMMRALTLHIVIQNKETNLYFPGEDGSNQRILWAAETATNAELQLSWLTNVLDSNPLLRALWPQKVWQNSSKQAKRWNAQEAQLPRTVDYPEPTIQTIGVGGAVTGRHQSCHVFDDLISFKAANSPTVMYESIQWFTASRALLDDPAKSLQFLIGTRWAVFDLWGDIIKKDRSVAVVKRSIVEEGKPIFPEMFSVAAVAQLEREFGALFPLIYMNEAYDASLVDFNIADVRELRYENGQLIFDENETDKTLQTAAESAGIRHTSTEDLPPGTRLTAALMRRVFTGGTRSRLS